MIVDLVIQEIGRNSYSRTAKSLNNHTARKYRNIKETSSWFRVNILYIYRYSNPLSSINIICTYSCTTHFALDSSC